MASGSSFRTIAAKWCCLISGATGEAPAGRLYPHERSLVNRLAGQPFALLGVNSDDDREALKKTMRKEKITWRSWWEGGLGGPIATKWQITTYPTIYVLDAGGAIRYVGAGDGNVDIDEVGRVVDALLKDLASAKQ